MDYVITTDITRRRLWRRIFGTSRLPVKHSHPRLMCMPSGEILAYDLDINRLHPFAVRRLVHYAAMRLGVPSDVIDVENCPILADDCKPARNVKPAVGFSFMPVTYGN